jgi:DNA polymerase-3 subunit delta
MKLTGARLSAFLRRPDPDIGAVLLYGPDHGLVRERSLMLLRSCGAAADDPFARIDLSAAALRTDPVALVDEAKAIAFFGGRRCVRVRDGADSIAAAVQLLLAAPPWEAFVIIEAGDLAKGSSLRQVFESSPLAAAIACYADDASTLRDVIGSGLAELGVRADEHALELLVGSLGADRGVTRSELEKLALYNAGKGVITADDVLAVVSDSHQVSLSAVAFAVGNGDPAELDRVLAAAVADGAEPVALLRSVAQHLQRLLTVRSALDRGCPLAEAVAALRPPLFFRVADDFRRQAKRCSRAQLRSALALATEAEVLCKTTGAAAAAIAADALFRMAAIVAAPERQPPPAHRPASQR